MVTNTWRANRISRGKIFRWKKNTRNRSEKNSILTPQMIEIYKNVYTEDQNEIHTYPEDQNTHTHTQTKQNKTKHNKAKQNKTKQKNKNKNKA